jgi:hypothetical protein
VGELSASDIDCDIVVLCTSIAMGTAEALARTVKAAQPAIRIVRLSRWKSPPDPYFDAVCDTPLDPAELLAELEQLRNMALGAPRLQQPNSQTH